MQFEINKSLETSGRGNGNATHFEHNHLYYFNKGLSEGRVHYRCWKKDCCGDVTKDSDGNVMGDEKNAPKPHLPTCYCQVTEIEYINRQAVQQVLMNTKNQPHSRAYDVIFQNLRDPRFVPQSYIDEKGIFKFPTKRSLSSSITEYQQLGSPKLPGDLTQLRNQLNEEKNAELGKINLIGKGPEPFIFHKEFLEGGLGLCVIFTCLTFLRVLFESTTLYFDGTYKVIPLIFQKFNK
jgi:hypothetical protein